MDDSKGERARPFTNSEICEIYIRGLLRNLLTVISRTFGDQVNIFYESKLREDEENEKQAVTGGNKDRGDCSYELLVYFLSHKRIADLIRCLLHTSKSSKQGEATYHELALAHCLFCLLQHQQHGTHDRHSIAIVTSMAMGRIIQPLSNLTAKTIETFGITQINQLTAEQLKVSFPKLTAEVQTAIDDSKRLSKKSNRLEKLDLSCHRLVSAFTLLVFAGIDDQQPFESFLK